MHKIAIFVIFIAVCLLSFQSSKAQYKAVSGARVTYDTAVVLPIHLYRGVVRKITIADSLIAGFEIQVDSLQKQITVKEKQIEAVTQQFELTSVRLQEVNTNLMDLNTNFEKLYKEATKPKKWHQRPVVFLVLAGLVLLVAN